MGMTRFSEKHALHISLYEQETIRDLLESTKPQAPHNSATVLVTEPLHSEFQPQQWPPMEKDTLRTGGQLPTSVHMLSQPSYLIQVFFLNREPHQWLSTTWHGASGWRPPQSRDHENHE